ncbi:type VI secretion system tip protein VgrG [Oxalobacteraceae bacterium OM1]|nr:type VI secretion system tip protein VgrG [Oxalobacteraceae bacterium OM1]
MPSFPSSVSAVVSTAGSLASPLDTPLASLLASFAAPFGQHARLLQLRFAADAGLAPDLLLPHRLTGREALSACYRYELTCLSADLHLELKDLLGQPVELRLLQADGAARVLAGVVTAAQQLGGDGGFAQYRLVIEPCLATLAQRVSSRVFQDQTVPQIVAAILDEHLAGNAVFAAAFSYEDRLLNGYPTRSYCLQYRESDLAFIERLLAEEGISYRFLFVDADDAIPHHTLLLFDDNSALDGCSQSVIRFHRADGSEADDTVTDWHGSRQLVAGATQLQTWDYQPAASIAASQDSRLAQGATGTALAATLTQYAPQVPYYASDMAALERYATRRQQAADLAGKQFSGQGVVRTLTAGTWFELREHPLHDQDDPDDRQFVVTELQFTAVNNLRPEDGNQEAPYTNRFTAVRRRVPLMPQYTDRHAKPTALGPQTALVVGPSHEEVYTDQYGRIRIQFHWQRRDEHPDGGAAFDENASTWVRVVTPSAGAQWGLQHLPRVGQEVLITFLENDIDRPICTGVIHNGTHLPPTFSGQGSLPANKALSGTKTKEHHGHGYNELLFDDTQQQLRVKLSSEHAKTQVNLGYLTHPRTDGQAAPRGEGFELRTDAAGALRAAKGLLLTAEPAPNAYGKQLDRQALLNLLDAALALSEQLGDTAHHQHAHVPETGHDNRLIDDDTVPGKPSRQGHQTQLKGALHQLEAGSNTGKATGNSVPPGGQRLVAVSGPDGIAMGSGQSATLTAATNLDLIAQRDTHQTSGRRWIHNVGESISLFVAGTTAKVKDTLKLIAARGNIQLQAQDGQLEATAQQAITITSVAGKVTIQAPQEILLTAGGGYLRIGKDIEIHNPGQQSQKAGSFGLSGPATHHVAMPKLPKQPEPVDPAKPLYSQQLDLSHLAHHDDPLTYSSKNKPYRVYDAHGKFIASGVTDRNGITDRIFTNDAKDLTVVFEEGAWEVEEYVRAFDDPNATNTSSAA